MDDTSFLYLKFSIYKWYKITIREFLQGGSLMGKINVRKRGKVYEYFFEGAKVKNKRTRISKSGFRTQSEAYQ